MDNREELLKKLPIAAKVQEVDIDLLKDLGKVFEERGWKGFIHSITFISPGISPGPMAGIDCLKICRSGPREELICTWECWRKGT
jgi:hypothetical protein